MIEPADLALLLGSGRFDLTHEKATQADVELFLAAHLPLGCEVSREHRLGPFEIPDFMVAGSIVVEVKVKGAQRRAIVRQLARYAEHREVSALILLTAVPMGRINSIGGKPAFVVSLGRAWL